jgi:hypothetical protein
MVLALLAAVVPAARVAAQSEVPSHECCLELLLPIGARAVALGGALSARTSAASAFGNPAGLAPMDSGQFILHHVSGAEAQPDAFSLFLTPKKVGTFGLSYLLVDYGESPSTDETGRQIGSISIRDHILVASFATGLTSSLQVGVNYSLYLFRVTCNGQCAGDAVSASTQTIDLGARYEPGRVRGLELGAAVEHLGLRLQVNNALQADPPPTRLHLSAAYEALHGVPADTTLTLWLMGELVARPGQLGSPTASLGAELSTGDVIFLRAGYAGGQGLGSGASVGVGLNYSRFTVDIAKSFSVVSLESDQTLFQVSFAIRF